MRLIKLVIVFFLTFSISLGVATVIRGLIPEELTSGITLLPYESYTAIYRWPPRFVRIELRSSDKIIFQIYYTNHENHTIIEKYTDRGLFTINVRQRRLNYYILMQNTLNKSVNVNLYITFYGFEKDFVHLSIILNAFSISISFVYVYLSIKRSNIESQD